MSLPLKLGHRHRRHSRKYAESSFDPPLGTADSSSPKVVVEVHDKSKKSSRKENSKEKKPAPTVQDLLGDYFVTGGRTGESTRMELRNVQRDSTGIEPRRARRVTPGTVIFKEPPRPYSPSRPSRRYEEDEINRRRREERNRAEEEELFRVREAEFRRHQAELRRREEYDRRHKVNLQHRQPEPRGSRHESYDRDSEHLDRTVHVHRYEPSYSASASRHEMPGPHIVTVVPAGEYDSSVASVDVRPRSRSRHREIIIDPGPSASEERAPAHDRGFPPMSAPRARPRSRRDPGGNDDGPSENKAPRIRGGGGPPPRATYQIVEDELEPEDLISIFYVRYGEIITISTNLTPLRYGGVGYWKDQDLLTHLISGYRRRIGDGNWLTWRYWWDSFMKEPAALILIQIEQSTVTYITIPYPDQPPEPPITNVRNETKLSIDLFGGKEASGQFRYLVRHYQGSTSRSRIMTSQIDKLIIKGQQMRAETDHYKYFLLLQVVEGQNGKALILGILLIIIGFLAFGLALGATQAQGLSWGDSFSIAGFGLASLSGLFALMALGQYLGLEDMSPGNPIGR